MGYDGREEIHDGSRQGGKSTDRQGQSRRGKGHEDGKEDRCQGQESAGQSHEQGEGRGQEGCRQSSEESYEDRQKEIIEMERQIKIPQSAGFLFAFLLDAGFDECREERMRTERAGQEFRMELRAEEERMHFLRQLGDLHQMAVRRAAGEHQSLGLEIGHIGRIDLVAMPVALGNDFLAVRSTSDGPFAQSGLISAKTHTAAIAIVSQDILLGLHDVDDDILRARVHFPGIGVPEAENVAGVFDDDHLHAVA